MSETAEFITRTAARTNLSHYTAEQWRVIADGLDATEAAEVAYEAYAVEGQRNTDFLVGIARSLHSRKRAVEYRKATYAHPAEPVPGHGGALGHGATVTDLDTAEFRERSERGGLIVRRTWTVYAVATRHGAWFVTDGVHIFAVDAER